LSITQNVCRIKEQIKKATSSSKTNPSDITIVGVTKYVTPDVAEELVSTGLTHLGENRPDKFLEKYTILGSLVKWHFIGTLQTRKVKDVINKIDYLHSLDRVSLAHEIQKRADKKIACFVQVNVSEENSKHGLSVSEVEAFVTNLAAFDKIEVVGLMTMAPDTDDEIVLRACFSGLKNLQDKIQNLKLPHAPCDHLSMGMSNDFEIAIEEGATFIRLGSSLTSVN